VTVSTAPYYHWNSRSDSLVAPYNSCSPNLVALQDYYRRRWGAVSLGCHNQRPVTGGSSLSSHAWGAACDPKFPDRATTVQAMDFTIANSAELGINTIHDYIRQMMWKPGGVGWVSASIGSVGGQWIHVETTPAMFGDGRPVEDKLTGSETDVALDGKDANLVAAVTWETYLELDGAKAPARVWLTEARKLASLAAAQSAANANAIAAVEAKVNALALTAGDADALKAAVAEIVRGILNDTVLEVRPPS
jgi:hypothetical protein